MKKNEPMKTTMLYEQLRSIIREALMDEYSVMRGMPSRSRWASEKGKLDPTAKEPYSKQDIAMTAQENPQPEKKGILSRIKSMFGGDATTGYEDAPSHWTLQQKQKFHRGRAVQMRDRAKQYAQMFADANEANDEKKKAYTKKMLKFYSDAANAHEKTLKTLKV